jgi:predicted transcriptional regulator
MELIMEKELEDFMKKLERFIGKAPFHIERSVFLDFDDQDFFQVFTEKRLEMLREIREIRPSSIRELAERLQRDIKNVYEDLCLLEKSNVIGFETTGRRKSPFVRRDIVVLKFW